MTSKQTPLVLLAALAIVGVIGYTAWKISPTGNSQIQARKVLFYQDSMHPWIKSDQPGKCTICAMDLTPIYEGETGFAAADNLVVLSSNSITVLNVQTEEVRRLPLVCSLKVAGTLEANESRKTIISAPAPGRIESLAVEYAGVEVQAGQRLFTFYSPELSTLKRRYVLLNQVTGQRAPMAGSPHPGSAMENPGAMHASNEISLAQRDLMMKARPDADPYYSDLLAPQSGTVVERNIYTGQYVAEGERLLTIVDASLLWFRFDVSPRQVPWLAPGQAIEVAVEGLTGKVFPAVIAFIDPTLNDATRTVKVRADIPNPMVTANGHTQRLLRFGLYAEGRVRLEIPAVLSVPRSAILYPGGSAYAYLDKGNGAYERRRVKLGRQGDQRWEVLDGLEEGERVVASGNVLIDAQAQFNQSSQPEEAAAAGLTSSEPESAPAHAVEAMSHAASHAGMVPLAAGNGSMGPLATNAAAMEVAAPATGQVQEMKPVRPATGGLRGGRDGIGDELMVRAIATRLAGRTNASAVKAAASQPAASPSKALQAFVAVAGGLSAALAADNLEKANQAITQLPGVLLPLQKEFGVGHRWSGMIQRLAVIKWAPAKNLAEARAAFLPFSTATVELVKQLRKEDRGFSGLKVYYCPMAPKPGLWMQVAAPLRNPFYGSKMLTCGEEVP